MSQLDTSMTVYKFNLNEGFVLKPTDKFAQLFQANFTLYIRRQSPFNSYGFLYFSGSPKKFPHSFIQTNINNFIGIRTVRPEDAEDSDDEYPEYPCESVWLMISFLSSDLDSSLFDKYFCRSGRIVRSTKFNSDKAKNNRVTKSKIVKSVNPFIRLATTVPARTRNFQKSNVEISFVYGEKVNEIFPVHSSFARSLVDKPADFDGSLFIDLSCGKPCPLLSVLYDACQIFAQANITRIFIRTQIHPKYVVDQNKFNLFKNYAKLYETVPSENVFKICEFD